jgi:hypothetical protein
MRKKAVIPSRDAWIDEVVEWEPGPTKQATLDAGPVGAHVVIRRPGPYIKGYMHWCIMPVKDNQRHLILELCKSFKRAEEWCAVCGWVIDGIVD